MCSSRLPCNIQMLNSASALQGRGKESCLHSFFFDFLCIRLLAALVRGEAAAEDRPRVVLERTEKELQTALQRLLAETLHPSLCHSLSVLQSSCDGQSEGTSDDEVADRHVCNTPFLN